MKNRSSKDPHNGLKFFFSSCLAAQTAQKQKSCTTKSPLKQDWVFRLGMHPLANLLFSASHTLSHLTILFIMIYWLHVFLHLMNRVLAIFK